MMRDLVKQMYTYHVYSEKDATQTVEEFKERQDAEGYTVTKTKIDYKVKKDRKTGEIVEEKWIVEITITYNM